ncbi:hypothetical protein CNY89_30610, partial [Amaricoccus sp. HAR-UPW-R2A-40]
DFAGFSQSLDASYDATTAQVFGEVGYAIERGPARRDFAGFSQSLDASYDATTAQVFGEVGYAIERGP